MNIDWLFFSDNSDLPALSENLRLIKFSKDDFNTLASAKLNLKVQIQESYKICDFKPCFGKIFEDHIGGYEFWGYFDIDLIFGNSDKFLNNSILDKNDIISTYRHFLSGPFAIFRNIENLNLLYKKAFEYDRILQDTEHHGFDENIQKEKNQGFSIRKVFYGFIFTANQLKINGTGVLRLSRSALMYEFQWYYKRKTIRNNHLFDMTEVVWAYSNRKKAKVQFLELIESDRSYFRNQIQSWKISWKNGDLVDVINTRELLGFHFVDSKNTIPVLIPKELNQISQITLTEKNIKVD